ncbi:phosphate-starvation-inducible PsiE family protein [Methylobacterium oryzae CBMB20]
MALIEAAGMTWEALRAMGGAQQILEVIDRLLFLLMLIEILHTVRVSMRSGTLTCEPFLIVGLIASIRRVLVITLQSSEIMHAKDWSPEKQALFQASMIEPRCARGTDPHHGLRDLPAPPRPRRRPAGRRGEAGRRALTAPPRHNHARGRSGAIHRRHTVDLRRPRVAARGDGLEPCRTRDQFIRRIAALRSVAKATQAA